MSQIKIRTILKKIGIIVLVLIGLFILFVIGFRFFVYPKAEAEYQHDADIIRLRHLEYYSDLIEEYKEKTGEYPLQDRTKAIYPVGPDFPVAEEGETWPVYVEIANSWQQGAAQRYNDAIPFSHYNGSARDFFYELEEGLGREIDEFYDPQKISSDVLNFYVYVLIDDIYYFTVHTYNEYPFGFKLGKNYYKVQVTNNDSFSDGEAVISDKLFSNEDYIREKNKELLKYQDSFSDIEKSLLHETKR